MKNETTEIKNQSVDKLASVGVALESVATHLSKAIDLLTYSGESRPEHQTRHAVRSIAASLIALTQHLVTEPDFTTFPPAPDFDETSLPTDSPITGEQSETTDRESDNPNPLASYPTDFLETRLRRLGKYPHKNREWIAETKAELASRESQSFQARNQAGNEFSAEYPQPSSYTPFENPRYSYFEAEDFEEVSGDLQAFASDHPEKQIATTIIHDGGKYGTIRRPKRKNDESPECYTFTRDELVELAQSARINDQLFIANVVNNFIANRLKERQS